MSWLEALIPGPVVHRSSAYTVPQINGQVVVADTLSATLTITLPLVPILGQIVVIKHASDDGYSVVISGNGKTIDGAETHTLTLAQDCISICYDGTAWVILSAYPVGSSGGVIEAGEVTMNGTTGAHITPTIWEPGDVVVLQLKTSIMSDPAHAYVAEDSGQIYAYSTLDDTGVYYYHVLRYTA